MKLYFRSSIISFLLGIVVTSCNSTAQLYRPDNKEKIYFGYIKDSSYSQLKRVLSSYSNIQLKDTIIIKYDFNNETCWDRLDEETKKHIEMFIPRSQARIQQKMMARPYLTVLRFREPGNNLNKIVKWDSSILIDDKKELFNLLVKESSICGSSIIIMPDKRFLFIRSDSHFEALEMNKRQIEDILNKK